MALVMKNGEQMNAKKNNVRENSVAVIEELESRELYSVTALPAVQCPSDGGPTMVLTQVISPRDPASGLPTGK
ncbi:MAG TPA: hypothetical protein VGP94_00210 [Tepidisphaeraceae bacterium]|nr:hypothetical protein [Tepidisphaeraceae bacterium]